MRFIIPVVKVFLNIEYGCLYMRYACTEAGEDFVTPSNLNLVFTTGSVNGEEECLTLSILDDFDFEGLHSFQVDIQSISPPVLTDIAGSGIVNIMDDDSELTHFLKLSLCTNTIALGHSRYSILTSPVQMQLYN